jgi:hypothetical protein
MNVMQKLQNRGMRAILQCDRLTHRIDMLDELKWLSVEQIVNFKTISFIRDIIQNDEYSYFEQFYHRLITFIDAYF